MRRLFGKKKEEAPPPDISQTTNMMNQRSDQMSQRIGKINEELAQISRDLKNPANKGRQQSLKRRAMQLIKQRKILENQQGTLDNQRFNLEQVQFMQDSIKTNMEVYQQMKANNDMLKKQMKHINITDVDNAVLDMEDMLDDANEINDILAQDTTGVSVDDDELEAEFAALECEDFEMGNANTNYNAPTADATAMPPQFTPGMTDNTFR